MIILVCILIIMVMTSQVMNEQTITLTVVILVEIIIKIIAMVDKKSEWLVNDSNMIDLLMIQALLIVN